MQQLWVVIDYLRNNPIVMGAAVLALVGLYYLLNQKPRLAREADERFDHLRGERSDHYKKLRPLGK